MNSSAWSTRHDCCRLFFLFLVFCFILSFFSSLSLSLSFKLNRNTTQGNLAESNTSQCLREMQTSNFTVSVKRHRLAFERNRSSTNERMTSERRHWHNRRVFSASERLSLLVVSFRSLSMKSWNNTASMFARVTCICEEENKENMTNSQT
jgi:hypothetical protein